MKCAVIVPDIHIPYHNKKALDAVMVSIANIKPSEIIFLGDLVDFYCIHGHGSKDPRLQTMLINEIEQVNKFLDQVDKDFPNIKKKYIEGNHEYRLARFILNNAPQLFGVTSCFNLLKFNERKNWEYIHYKNTQLTKVLDTNLFARHEPLAGHARLSVQRSMTNMVYGHIHRIECSYAKSIDNRSYVNFSPGWLGDDSNYSIFGYTPHRNQWQLGFSTVYSEQKEFFFLIHEIKKIGNSYKT